MSDQLKAFGKYLFLGIFLLPALAKEPKLLLDASRVTIEKEQKLLQTALWSYEKDDQQIDLIGVVHIADEEYYDDLNFRFKSYDAVFFEMIANKASVKELQAKREEPSDDKSHSGLNQFYSLYKTMMNLTMQNYGIDYTAKNLIHADMSPAELKAAQEETGETILDAVLNSEIDLSKVDQGIVMRAMMTGESSLLKNELMGMLASADDGLGDETNPTVTIGGRNDKCLEVLKETLFQNKKLKKVAIFYGAGHLPDFHRKLSKDGWKHTNTEWLNAWEIETPKE